LVRLLQGAEGADSFIIAAEEALLGGTAKTKPLGDSDSSVEEYHDRYGTWCSLTGRWRPAKRAGAAIVGAKETVSVEVWFGAKGLRGVARQDPISVWKVGSTGDTGGSSRPGGSPATSPDSNTKFVAARPLLAGLVKLPGFLRESTVQSSFAGKNGEALNCCRGISIGRTASARGPEECRCILLTYPAGPMLSTTQERGAMDGACRPIANPSAPDWIGKASQVGIAL